MKSSYVIIFCAILFVLNIEAQKYKTLLYSDWITCNHNHSLHLDVSKVLIHFHDFQNGIKVTHQIEGAVDKITSFYHLSDAVKKITRGLIFYVPGFKSEINLDNEELVRETFSNVPNIYLVIVDYSGYTSGEGGRITNEVYEKSVTYSYYIGKALGKFLAQFHGKGIPSENIHCIGHSLGGQILGVTGEEYARLTFEMVGRITGIDPVGPCFTNNPLEEQLNAAAATYVEVYHCNPGGLATTSVLAHADFFINKENQENSKPDKYIHRNCLSYYMKTVHNPNWYMAWKCESFRLFMQGKCYNNKAAIAGYHNPGNANGVYYTSTESYFVKI